MRVLAFSGSLQASSTNTLLVQLARTESNHSVDVDIFEGLVELPYFNPDLDGDRPPEPVRALRSLVGACDALLIASPEYAHEMPGVLKNALDWLVKSGELYAMPVAILCAAPSSERGTYVRQALQRTLQAQGAKVVVSRTVAVPRATSSSPEQDAEVVRVVRQAVDGLVAAVELESRVSGNLSRCNSSDRWCIEQHDD